MVQMTPYRIRQRELDILSRLVQGKSYTEVGGELGIRYGTVRTYIANMLRITGARNSRELVALYMDNPTAFAIIAPKED